MSKHSIDDMVSIANNKKGQCLSERYINNKTKLSWKCAKGHRWEATPDSIIHGSWCPVCAGSARLDIKDMMKIAKIKGGKCLSKNYINNKTKLSWKCSEGHMWESAPNSVSRGSWCPVCAGNARLSMKDMKKIAKDRGGRCLSDAYINSNTKLVWRCSVGHRWEANPHDIRNGSWCPICYKLKINEGKIMNKNIFFKMTRNDVYEIGRICVKLSGKDAGKICIVIDIVNEITVFVDGYSRRKKCNIKHLEQTEFMANICRGITHDDVIRILNSEFIPDELKVLI